MPRVVVVCVGVSNQLPGQPVKGGTLYGTLRTRTVAVKHPATRLTCSIKVWVLPVDVDAIEATAGGVGELQGGRAAGRQHAR